MTPDGKVRVMVKSRRVPVGAVDISIPVFSASGLPLGAKRDRVILYDYVLDGEHERAVQEAQKISSRLGVELEVIDSGKRGFLKTLLSSLRLGRFRRPTIVVSPPLEAACSEVSQTLARGI